MRTTGMKLYVFFVFGILAFSSAQDAGCEMLRSNSAIVSPTSSQKTTPSHKLVPKSSGSVLATSYPTNRSHDATSSPTKRQKTPTGHTIIPKNSGNMPTRSQKTLLNHTIPPKRSGRVHTGYPTASPKTLVRPTIRTTGGQKLAKPRSSPAPYPTSTKTPNSSSLPATTAGNWTTTRHSTGTSTLVSASITLTVSNGQTTTAEVGWAIVAVGIGGAVAVGGGIFPVPAGTEVIIVENGESGEDVPVTIETSMTPTTTSTSKSTSRLKSRSKSRSSSSSTASPTPYNIYPRPGSTRSQQSAFTRDLERIARSGSVRGITGGRDQLLLWVASLTPAQASELRRNSVVRGLNVDGPLRINLEGVGTNGTSWSPNCSPENCSLRKRDGTILMQQGARDELKIISQARGASLSELPGYAYDSMGGQGITVYVIDTGINPYHQEFRNMRGNIRWLYLPGEPQIEGDINGHGTCVISKIATPTLGVAKSANIVVVKIEPMGGMGTLRLSNYFDAFSIVAEDIASRNLQGRAVLMTALNMDPNREDVTENDRTTFMECVRDVIDLDVAVVSSSGNMRQVPGFTLATYPPLLATQLPIIVVGAVETSGIYAHYSQGLAPELTVSAVGRVLCASGQRDLIEDEGTSFAAPVVAGLAAYLMSLDQYRVQLQVPGSVARNVRDLIKSLAYARRPLQPAVLWNGIDPRQIHCPVRRDAAYPGCLARNTTSPIGPPVQSKTPGRPPNPVIPGQSPKVTATSSSNPPPPSNAAGWLTIMVHFTSDSFSLVRGSSTTTTTTVTPASGSNSLLSGIATTIGDPVSGNVVEANNTQGFPVGPTPSPPVYHLTN